MQYLAFFLSSLFMCSTVFASAASALSLGSLSSALNERMLLMRDVARYKVEHGLPVEDPLREQTVFSETQKEAEAAGLDPRSVEPFVRYLMNAGKAVQYRYLADWLGSPDFSPSSTALTASGQRIHQLDRQILTAISQRLLAGAFSDADRAWLLAQLDAPNLSEADKGNVITALFFIKRTL